MPGDAPSIGGGGSSSFSGVPAALPAYDPATLPARDPATLPARDPATLPVRDPAALPAREPAALPAVDLPDTLPAREWLRWWLRMGLPCGVAYGLLSDSRRGASSVSARAIRLCSSRQTCNTGKL